MPKYQVMYKCQMCGELIALKANRLHDISAERVENKTIKLVQNTIKYYKDQQKDRLFTTHNCGDGNCGLALFAGLKRVGE